MHDVFTRFANACGVIGDALTVKDMLALTEFGSQERMELLERREPGMRFPPLLHVILQAEMELLPSLFSLTSHLPCHDVLLYGICKSIEGY